MIERFFFSMEELYTFTLLFTILTPSFGILLLIYIPETNIKTLHKIALQTSLINFVISIFLWLQFDKLTSNFQFICKLGWIPFSNLNIFLGIDEYYPEPL